MGAGPSDWLHQAALQLGDKITAGKNEFGPEDENFSQSVAIAGGAFQAKHSENLKHTQI